METKPFVGTVICTLCLLVRDGKVWLAQKTRKLLIDKWNGYGGKLEERETIREAAIRETFVETGRRVRVRDEHLDYRAFVTFHTCNKEGQEIFRVPLYVYVIREWVGTPIGTAEMKNPTRFPVGALPLDDMAPGDQYWLPLVLEGKLVTGHIHYTEGQQGLFREPEIRVVDALPEDRL